MRVNKKNSVAENKDLEIFTKWVLDIGNGDIPSTAHDNKTEPTWIEIPHDLLIFTEGPKILYMSQPSVNSLLETILLYFEFTLSTLLHICLHRKHQCMLQYQQRSLKY
uniref:Uncharacterized protein n=1 Tax=Arundo donax TaxID=35708 RepID=A0A0A9FZ21_ARUDO